MHVAHVNPNCDQINLILLLIRCIVYVWMFQVLHHLAEAERHCMVPEDALPLPLDACEVVTRSVQACVDEHPLAALAWYSARVDAFICLKCWTVR